MQHYSMYHPEIPEFIHAFAETSAVRRLMGVGMNCGCEYTSFSRFEGLDAYSRYDHSLGVALIIWHFTHDIAQSVAGLFHDVATPVFAHVVDFLRGDYLQQESTEDGTTEIIMHSDEILKLLGEYGIKTDSVCDYHQYPVADNDMPMLSADRLEYSLGNILNFKIRPEATVKAYYEDLKAGLNDKKESELVFCTKGIAEDFAMAALSCSKIYVSDEDRYSMQMLSEILQKTLDLGVLTSEDLYSVESDVIAKLKEDKWMVPFWTRFCSFTRVIKEGEADMEGEWRTIYAKKRHIDPMVEGAGRVSSFSTAFAAELQDFLNSSQDYRICAVP